MARAIIRDATDTIEGDTLRLDLTVTYFGGDVPGGSDTSLCTAVLTASMSEQGAIEAQRDAIVAEAQRLGYSLAPTAITSIPRLIGRV